MRGGEACHRVDDESSKAMCMCCSPYPQPLVERGLGVHMLFRVSSSPQDV